jgi:hypothetical protein
MPSYFSWFISAALLFSPSPPQQTAPASDPRAVALLRSSVAALTGGTAISDVTLAGTATSTAGPDNDSGQVTAKALATGGSRMDLTLTSGPHSELRATGSNGTPAGTWSGADAVPHTMASFNVWTPSSWFFPLFTLQAAASAPGFLVTYIGQEERNGVAVQHLTLSQQVSGTTNAVAFIQKISQTEIYLDASTQLPVAVAFYVHPDLNSSVYIPVELLFSDYRAVNGAQVSFHVQRHIQDGLALDLHFQTAIFNSGLTSAAFSLQ